MLSKNQFHMSKLNWDVIIPFYFTETDLKSNFLKKCPYIIR